MAGIDHLKMLVELLCRPYSMDKHYEDRARFMEIIGSLFGEHNVWVCLWLLDANEGRNELRLDQIVKLKPDGVSEKFTRSQFHFGGVFAVLPPGGQCESIDVLAKRTISHRLQSGPLQAISKEVGPLEGDESFHALAGHDGEDIGCIQVVAANAVPIGEDNAVVLPLATRALADQIRRSREYRIWNRQKEIGAELMAIDSVERALQIMAEAVRKGCWAQYSSITYTRCDHRQEIIKAESRARGSELQSSQKLIQNVVEKKHAIRRGAGEAPAIQTANSNFVSGRLSPNAAMAVPVLVESWCGENAKRIEGVACVIEVIGKNSSGHFYSSFSNQDENFVSGIANMLAEALPRLEMLEAQKLVADEIEIIESNSTAIIDTGKDVLNVFFSLEKLVRQIAPCSTFSAVVGSGNLLHLSDESFRDAVDSAVPRIDAKNSEAIITVGNGNAYVIPLAHLESGGNKLVIGISTNDILKYRKTILGYLCREFGSLIGDRLRYRKMIKDLTETRHALRSGLTGVVTNLDAIRRIYHRYRSKGPDRLYEVLVHDREFSESLDWATLFVQKTAVFIDETRLLLDNLNSNTLKITFFDIERVLDEAINCLMPEASDRGCRISFEKKISPDLSTGWADRDLIYILLFNIIDNAIKYSFRDRTINIEIGASQDQWRIRVINLGVPIPKDKRQTIFQLFHRESSGMAPDSRRPGTGLGLSVSAMILTAHDPTREIEVDSIEQSDGSWRTCFTIPIPRLLKAR